MSHTHHDHGHDHSHTHSHPTENYSARKHPEFVVLEIGDDLGALIVRADPDMHAVEIEISPDGVDDQRSHKEVLERSINGHPAFSAVFDGLRAGTYTLWVDDEARARGVKVEGGHVGQLDWRHAHVRT